jgi:hypothetical protein
MIETYHLAIKKDGKPLGRVAVVTETERNTTDVTCCPHDQATTDELVRAMQAVIETLCSDAHEMCVLRPGERDALTEMRA